jgi:hypothetical protein
MDMGRVEEIEQWLIDNISPKGQRWWFDVVYDLDNQDRSLAVNIEDTTGIEAKLTLLLLRFS